MTRDDWTRWMIQTAERWNDIEPIVLSTGIDEVDTDHHRLVAYILELNHLISKLEEDKFNMTYLREQQRLLVKIHSYAKEHFAREEELMDKYGIDDGIQRAQHTSILEMLEKTIADFESGKMTVSLSLKVDIMEWVVEHINDVDHAAFSLPHWSGVLEKAETWDDLSFIIKRCGLDLIDGEHKELVECTLKLSSVNPDGKDSPPRTRKILEELSEIVERHFADEEAFMERYKLSGLDKQREQHALFKKILKEKAALDDENLVKNLRPLKKFIIEWWCKHINALDYNTVSFNRHVTELIDNSAPDDDLAWMLASSSVKEVDEQHTRFLRMIEELSRAYESKDGGGKSPEKLFEEMLAFAQEHFAYEEDLMARSKSPLLEIHKKEHEELVEKYVAYFEQIKNGSSKFSVYLRNKLVRSLVTHTNGIDVETFEGSGGGDG